MENIKTITNDLAGNYIAAMMDLGEFKLDLNFQQAKYLASIMVTMQKHSIDEILNLDEDIQLEYLNATSFKLEKLHTLICEFDETKINDFNPENL